MSEPLQILCVEDSDEDFILLGRELKKIREPFVLSRADNRENFGAALDRFPDVILCDHNLPSFSSTEAFRIMRSRGLSIPFILVTASIGEEEGVRHINDGMDDYILKDRLGRLPSSVVRAIKLSRAERDREKYYHALLARERRFRALVEHSEEAVVLCDEHLDITYASPAFSEIFNVDENAATGKKLHHVIQARDPQAFSSFCEKAFRVKGKPFEMEFEAFCPGRESVCVECTINNLTHDEHVNAVVLNIRDNTARIKSEESLRRTQAVLAATINNSDISYVLVDKEFTVVTYNSSAEKRYLQAFGMRLTEGAVIFDYLPGHRKAEMIQRFQSALKGDKLRYEISFPSESGSDTWFEVNVFPVLEEAAHLVGVILATEDITQRKQAEIEKDNMTRDLLAQNKNLEQFAYIISHNLRAPVASILGLGALLEKKSSLTADDIDKCTRGMAAAARNIDQVVRDLNIILQSKKSVDEAKQPVNLLEVTENTRKSLKNEIENTGSSITTDFQVSTCYCIRTYMNSIFLNLISNSLRYRVPGVPAQIHITSYDTGNSLRITFEDNGMGIDLEAYGDKIFGLYRRFHVHDEGRGIGLYMVKTQVELMGGTIGVNSIVGDGTRFTIDLPRS